MNRLNNKRDIRAFRTAISNLKKARVIHASIDARRAQPTRPLLNAIRKFKSVLDGTAKSIPLAKVNITEKIAHQRLMRVAKPFVNTPEGRLNQPARIIVPKFKEEKIRIKAGNIEHTGPSGIRRLELPKVRTDTVRHFFQDLKASKTKLPDTREGEYFAARFFGGRTQLFESLRDLLNTLNVYESVVRAHTHRQTDDVIHGIEIVTIPEQNKFEWGKGKALDRVQKRRRKTKKKKG